MANILNSLFRSPQGYFVSSDPDPAKGMGQQAVVEKSSVTCGHCCRIVLVPPMCKPEDTPYALCWGCRRNICLACDEERARTLTCDVIEKKLERWEAKDRFRRELG
jgi:hypothetical protein